ncbi:MAG: SdrD B-like domain-containing protein [Clostridia bacterium]
MKGIIKKTLASILVMLMLINSSALVIISEAIGEVEETTNNKNVQFSVYFKDENGNKTTKISQKMDSEEVKLYAQISIKQEGYLENASIELKNSNFTFDIESQSEGVTSKDSNKVVIDYIGAGETREIELKVKANKQEEYKIEELTRETTVELKGTYVNSKSSNIEIKAEREVQWKQTSPYDEENKGITLSQEIITNKVMKYNGEEKRIVQEEIKNGLEGNGYPIKETEIEIQAAKVNKKNPEKVIVNIVEKNLTTEKEIEEGDYEYNKETGKIVIKRENKANEENQVEWKQEGEDKYIVTYVYEETEEVEEQEIEAKAKMVLYDEKGTEIEAEDKIQTEKAEKDGTVRVEIENQENEIYKGKIYADGERKITENVKINVNSIGTSESIEISEEEKEELNSGKITINKNEEEEILGQEGKITITNAKTGEKIAEINKETEAEENGEVGIELNNVKAIKVKTSKPQKVGRINIEIEKTIKESNQKEIQNKQEIKYGITGKYTNEKEEEIEKAEATIELKETTTEATMEISKNTLNTIEENEIEIKATLKEDTERNDLYKNPKIEIELPKQVEEAEITNINKMYAENFNISSSKIEEKNGRKVIEISLKGEDKTYVEDIIGGPTVIIDLKIKLNKTAKTETEKITMKYTNEKARGYEKGEKEGQEEKEIEITSPTGIITTNKIEELKVKTVGEEEKQNVKIEVGKEEKEAGIEKEIINNTGAKVENVVITGRLATNGKENNMGIKMTEGIKVEGVEGATVYYTEKEEVTTEVEDSSNEWNTEITDSSKVKNYMVKIAKMEETETAKIKYEETIPESLEYNKNAVETYGVEYTDTTTSTKQEVKGTEVEMTTGTGPNIEVELTAEVGGEKVEDNSEIKQGEVIKYIAKVTNTGTEEATNVEVNGMVPEGTALVKAVEDYDLKDNYYTELETKTITTSIAKIGTNETKEVSYEVRVNKDTEKGTVIENKVSAKYNDITKESNKTSNEIDSGDLQVTTMSRMNDSVNITQNDTIKYSIIIENNSNKDKQNLKVKLQYPEILELIRQEDSEIKDNVEKVDDNTLNVKSVKANGKTIIDVYFNVEAIKQTENTKVEFNVKVLDGNITYRSNNFIKIANLSEYLELKLKSNNQDDFVKSGEQIEYDLELTGKNMEKDTTVTLIDELPSGVTLKNIYLNDKELKEYKKVGSRISFKAPCNANDTTIVKIVVTVNQIDNLKEDKEIANKMYAQLSSNTYESNEIKHIIQKNSNSNDNNNNNNNNNNGNNSNNGNNNNNNGNNSNTEVYEIKGKAFVDDNSNGKVDNTESGKENIKVRLVNSDNNELAKYNGKNIETTTNSNGEYTLQNVPNGNYIVVFEYDNTIYQLTAYKKQGVQENENSDVFTKKINIDGTEKEYAVTDIININNKSVANVNMGLITLKEMNLKLEKSINKVTVQNSSETTTYNYSAEDLAKVEIHAKKLVGTTIIVEYQIKVTNTGKVDAYVRNIKDDMPKDMTFKSELNKQWYQKDGVLYTTSLTNTKIQPGETKTISLILMKQMNNSNTGLVNNNAEIVEIYNQQDLKETNLNDNKDSAKLIVSIKTGEFIKYSVIFVVIFVIILSAVIIIINRKNSLLGGR